MSRLGRQSADAAQACEAILATIRRIPAGAVATYGQVALEAGFPGRARLVAYALRHVPEAQPVPWHRVINAQGRSSLSPGAQGQGRQLGLLAEEGVEHRDGRIDLRRFRWQPRSDVPLLD